MFVGDGLHERPPSFIGAGALLGFADRLGVLVQLVSETVNDLRAGEDCRGETTRGGYSCTKTDFGSRYASSPAAPCSRPTPEALKPPNGAAASTMPQAFT